MSRSGSIRVLAPERSASVVVQRREIALSLAYNARTGSAQ
jgi:hypothetical protein